MHAWLAVRHTQAVARRQSPKPKDLRYWSGMLCLGLTHRDTACLPNVQYHKMKQYQRIAVVSGGSGSGSVAVAARPARAVLGGAHAC